MEVLAAAVVPQAREAKLKGGRPARALGAGKQGSERTPGPQEKAARPMAVTMVAVWQAAAVPQPARAVRLP